MKKIIISYLTITFSLILFVGCTRDISSGYDNANINFSISYADQSSKQAIDEVKIIIRKDGEFLKEVGLDIHVGDGVARGSTTLDYGTYDFRLEMLTDGVIRYSGETNGKLIDKNTSEVAITYTATPIITLYPSTVLNFGDIIIQGYAGQMEFTLEGRNLTGPITVTPPQGFEVYKTSEEYPGSSNTITFDPVSGSVDATVYVNIEPLEVKLYIADISCTSPGALDVLLPVRCNGLAIPLITVTPNSLNFGDVEVNEFSDQQSFMLEGSNLLSDVTVQCADGFEISKTSGAGWTNQNLYFPHSAGSLNAPVYVRGRAVVTGEKLGNLICMAEHTADKQVGVRINGVITQPYISANPTHINFGDVPVGNESEIMSFTLTGANLTQPVSVASDGFFWISKTINAADFSLGTLSYPHSSGTINSEVYVKIAPGAVETFNGYVRCSTTDLTSNLDVTTSVNGVPNDGMIIVEGGTFMMGDSLDMFIDNQPVHAVTVSEFKMGKKEVTQEEWIAIMGTNPSEHIVAGNLKLPVDNVAWYEALVYCNKRSINESLLPCYSIGGSTNPDNWGSVPTEWNATWSSVSCNWTATGYKLPTEAEWEFAARGGNFSQGYIYSGSNTIGEVAWNMNNTTTTQDVGLKASNEIGLFDMTGNVVEWCWDRYEASYYQYCVDNNITLNPRGPSDGDVVLRGGSFSSMIEDCTPVYRRAMFPYTRESTQGLRLVKKP
jgi:formylglycine-generating enzyme